MSPAVVVKHQLCLNTLFRKCRARLSFVTPRALLQPTLSLPIAKNECQCEDCKNHKFEDGIAGLMHGDQISTGFREVNS